MMNIELKTTTAIIGPMTAAERIRGRYMRSPDGHGDGGGAGDGGDSSGADAGAGDDGDGSESTEDKLAKEFGEQSSDESGSDDGDDGQEDLGSDETGEDGDGSDGEGEDEESAEGEDGTDESKKNRTKEHVAALQRATTEAEARASAATREAEKWRRIAEGAPQAPEAVGDGESDPNAEPDPADFDFGAADPEYIAAKAEWKALTRLRKEGEVARYKAELNGLEAKYQTAVPKALEKYPDYDEVVTKGGEGENPKWVCSPIVAVAIRDSAVGTDVAYHLASNPTEASRIAGLNNYEQAREFGRLEGRYLYEAEKAAAGQGGQDGNDKGGGNGAQARQRSNAPKPPAKNLARGAGGKFSVPADTNDFAAFDKAYGNGPKKR